MSDLSPEQSAPHDLRAYVDTYANTAECNDHLHQEFTARTNAIPWLKEHRDTIEANEWGTGDRAFHYMWYLLCGEVLPSVWKHAGSPPNLLEIGVFKGQVISLWSMLAERLGVPVAITAVSPFVGNFRQPPSFLRQFLVRVRMKLDRAFRRKAVEGNLYPRADYLAIVREVFGRFHLDPSKITFLKGYSTDEAIVAEARQKRYSIIYIDGDHSYEGVRADIDTYSGLLTDTGLLVMDDASYFLPGSVFWKGHRPVSQACDGCLEAKGFTNVLNIGHNRVYRRTNPGDAR